MTVRKEITGRELLLLALGSVLIAVVMEWPLVLHLGHSVPKDLGDPLAQAWQPAWDGHALLHQPLHFFQSNQFWPLPDTLAFSDALIGYTPAGLIGSGPEAAIARYDLLFLFAYALAFAGAYLLARELGVGPAGATVAGMAFAFAPFRLEQDGHMQIISSGGIPLALALAVRGWRLGRPAWIVAAWAVAIWQLSIGFSLGLPFAYLLAAIAVVALVLWWRRGHPPLPRRLVAATALGALAFLAAAAILAQPYLRVAADHPEGERSASDVAAFSGPPSILAVAPDENFIWGPITAPLRDGLENVPEKTLFPGLAILVLAFFGARAGPLPRQLRIGLVVGAALVAILALGFRMSAGLLWPYRWLYDFAPGFDGIRTPGRLITFTSLALALLAGAGAGRAYWAVRRRSGARAGALAACGLALLVAVEGLGIPFDPFDSRAQPTAPAEAPVSFASIPAPQLHLPATRPEDNRRYLLWSTDGFPDMVNGRSSLDPTVTARIYSEATHFPDRASVRALRDDGIRSVVLHTYRSAGTPQQGAQRKPIAGLPLTRRALGSGVILYELDPKRPSPG